MLFGSHRREATITGRVPPLAAMLPRNRLHLQHGPIDLVVQAEGEAGEVQAAYAALTTWFAAVLDDLCDELPVLRNPVQSGSPALSGAVARRMAAAVMPYAASDFITPMAAVAGAVADAALATLCRGRRLRRAFVNNGGDIALHLTPGERFRVGLIDRPDQPSLFAGTSITHADGVGGIATSGWRGRSFSLGIADAVTICAATAAEADAAATIVANAVDLPGHPAILRQAANDLQPDSDLGSRPVTRGVGRLDPAEVAGALAAGVARAEELIQAGLITAAALHCQGRTEIADAGKGLVVTGA